MDAGRAGVVIRIDDMRAEERYRDYTARVVEVGVRSSLSIPLPYQGSTIGALNTYSTQPEAFASAESEEAGTTVAEGGAVGGGTRRPPPRLGGTAPNPRLAM